MKHFVLTFGASAIIIKRKDKRRKGKDRDLSKRGVKRIKVLAPVL